MTESRSRDWDRNDILQDLMGSRMPPTELPDSLADLPLDDPTSLLGLQFAPDPGAIARGNASVLGNWMPFPSTSGQFHAPRLSISNEQDAWNPLQITGVPAGFGMQYVGKPAELDGRYHGQYNDPSEIGSQYTGLHSSDSGYSSRRSVAGCAMDSSSPKLGPQEVDHEEGQLGFGVDRLGSSPMHEIIKCGYPNCSWTGKCPSDKKKHEARHQKLFKCDEPNCTRKQGFGTINDLARHKKCVHKQEPERGPKVLYMCFGHNCPRRNKKWPRLDNFRQHLSRMHNDEDMEGLLNRSKEWYESCIKPQEISGPLMDRYSHEPEFQIPASERFEVTNQDAGLAPKMMDCQTEDLDYSQKFHDDGYDDRLDSTQTRSFDSQPVACDLPMPTLKSFDLSTTLDQIPSTSQDSPKHDKMEDFVSEAATNMINALTKIMNNNQRRRSQGEEEEVHDAELDDRKREMLQRILSAALDRLSSGQGEGSDKKDWIQCDRCPKRTRLRCEMKKHKKRHDRPYGCTFPKCNKTFGSKADWKRHENSQHYHLQSWRCTHPTNPNPTSPSVPSTLPCARLFYRQEIYIAHLRKHHNASEESIRTDLCRNRIGRDGQSQFWCGFCRVIIPLQSQGLEAWNERFNHIDIKHFKNGESIGDWLPPEGHLTKRREREEKARGGDSDDESSDSCSDDEDTQEDCMFEQEYPPQMHASIPQKRKSAAPHQRRSINHSALAETVGMGMREFRFDC